MFIKLTNANEKFRGKPVVINTAFVNSAYELVENNTSVKEAPKVTVLCTPDDRISWVVQESIDEVVKLLNKAYSQK
jgi:hypothetical protein